MNFVDKQMSTILYKAYVVNLPTNGVKNPVNVVNEWSQIGSPTFEVGHRNLTIRKLLFTL